MSSEFPLFRLPLIVLNHGLKLMTPFEILSLSLCSKRCKTVCQSLRNQLKCKEKAVKFQLKFSKKREIQLEFNYYPNTRWIFELEQFMAIKGNRETIIDKLYLIFQRKNSDRHELSETTYGVHIPNWIPIERSLEDIRDHIAGEEKLLKFYVPMEDGCFGFRTFINHLSYIFNITLTDLELHFQDFTREENEIIIDSYCGNKSDRNCAKKLTLVGESENTPEDDEVVNYILSRQEAKSDLTIDILSSKFRLKKNQLIPNQLVIRNPKWVTSVDIEYFNSFSVFIFMHHHLTWWWYVENLIERWYSGWTPKWTVMMIEFRFINIDDIINKIRVRIPDSDLLRSEETIEGPDGLSHRIKYSIHGNDGTIGEFLVENNKYLYIKMRDNTELSLTTFITMTKEMM
ncbi:hypothetical protein GCK72_012060 [Caenorhabditis remanei]|uniref:F-box domain-containing protein n=1 Tax=Caenorhabditis remanei TaxID=31234 RepID=A0A6A5GK00_CAERE|nr:hypothetical protein GCK72_012060 [Caenorhabditis remanei]KAF1755610.1 hypothetical protein GCK72_012060 [Caenorhabditis remanei]